MSNKDTPITITTLKNPPIIEAVVEIKCAAQAVWEEEVVKPKLQESMSEYEFLDSRYGYLSSIQFEDGETTAPPIRKDWIGARFRSEDEKYITSFTNEAFTCSRLEPYETWDSFKQEALRIWNVHEKIAESTEVERLDLRYINRIPIDNDHRELSDYIHNPPDAPNRFGLDVYMFLHKDTFIDSTKKYAINITKTLQRPDDVSQNEFSLILDINIHTLKPITIDLPQQNNTISEKFDEMRELKNQVFFGTITDELRERFNGE